MTFAGVISFINMTLGEFKDLTAGLSDDTYIVIRKKFGKNGTVTSGISTEEVNIEYKDNDKYKFHDTIVINTDL